MSLSDTVVIQIVGSLVGILSIIMTRLVDRWLPPLENRHKHNRRELEEDEQLN